jgi:DNA-directed RNA polymerase specialized sigma24 family protein
MKPSSPIASLYARHVRALRLLALSVLGHREEAEDVVQDVFVSLLRGEHPVPSPASERAILDTLVLLACHARRNKHRRTWTAERGFANGLRPPATREPSPKHRTVVPLPDPEAPEKEPQGT